jgi:AcrR family transcriptional regulator
MVIANGEKWAPTQPEPGPSGEAARHLLKTAARLFAIKGYDGTSTREIVEEAGVTKPTLYYHFGSKEGLGKALVTEPLQGLIDRLRGLMEAGDDPRTTLEAVLAEHFAFCLENPERTRFIYGLFFGPLGHECVKAELNRFGEQLTALLEEAVRKLGEANRCPPERIETYASAFRGLVIVHTADHLYRGRELGPDLPRRLVGDLLRGFGAEGEESR